MTTLTNRGRLFDVSLRGSMTDPKLPSLRFAPSLSFALHRAG
jgi:hypothetical protein